VVSDDGQGFDPRQPPPRMRGESDSFGLRATRERVQQLGGVLTIDSAPGTGTTLVVELSRKDAA
jgi:signal transduction histidine kinase